MKQGVFITILMVAAFIIAYLIFTYMLPDYIKAGGPLVIVLIMLSLMVVTFIFERLLALNKAKGKGSLTAFLRKVQAEISKENIDGAIEICDKQRGSCANVLRAGLEKYKLIKGSGAKTTMKETQEEIQHAIEESMMLEVPLL
ncbi:MAG TPA: hypothetical protein PLZ01_08680, partial [bacterium]|nr:hypothetical protein [bacterium]